MENGLVVLTIKRSDLMCALCLFVIQSTSAKGTYLFDVINTEVLNYTVLVGEVLDVKGGKVNTKVCFTALKGIMIALKHIPILTAK